MRFGDHDHGAFGDPRRAFGFGPGFPGRHHGGEPREANPGHPFPPPPPFPPGPGGPWGGFPGAGGWPGFGSGHGSGHGRGHSPGRGRGHGRGRRQRRGDVRAAILALLAERPMHGYEMIQEINERSGGFWRPSPGSVYPTLQLLTDEGLITAAEGAGSKRLFELTDEGRAEAAKQDTPPWEHIAKDVDPRDVDLRTSMGQLVSAIFQVAQAGSSGQKARAVEVLNEARRELYAILGEAEPVNDDTDADLEADED